jgi:hypothetical protein
LKVKEKEVEKMQEKWLQSCRKLPIQKMKIFWKRSKGRCNGGNRRRNGNKRQKSLRFAYNPKNQALQVLRDLLNMQTEAQKSSKI